MESKIMTRQYLIYSPPLTQLSAGVKALHMLRDKLESAGHKATMVPMGVCQVKLSARAGCVPANRIPLKTR